MRHIPIILLFALCACTRNGGRDGEWIPNDTLAIVSEHDGKIVFTHSDIPSAIIGVEAKSEKWTIWIRLKLDAFERYAELPEDEPLAIRVGGRTVARFKRVGFIGGSPALPVPDTLRADGKHLHELLFTYHRFASDP